MSDEASTPPTDAAAAPIDRAAMAREFRFRFGAEPRVFRAPGRVNLIGEHTDHSQGFVLPVTTALYTWLAIAPRTDGLLRVQSMDLDGEVRLDTDRAADANVSGWGAYVRGVVLALQERGFAPGGADLLVRGSIPLGAGLSSSASFEVALALALLDRAGAAMERPQLALACQRAESEFVGVRCGIMDQFVIACSQPGSAMLLDCRTLQHRPVALPGSARFVVLNSGVKRELRRDSAYNSRRADYARAVAALRLRWAGIESLRDATLAQLEEIQPALDDDAVRRARHVIRENARVHQAEVALEKGDVATLGCLLNESHRSLRDDYQVSCAEVDALVDEAQGTRGVLGARMVGAGFGGCVIALVEARGFADHLEDLLGRADRVLARKVWHHTVHAAGAAGELRRDDAGPGTAT